jgi:hypothetical protein
MNDFQTDFFAMGIGHWALVISQLVNSQSWESLGLIYNRSTLGKAKSQERKRANKKTVSQIFTKSSLKNTEFHCSNELQTQEQEH